MCRPHAMWRWNGWPHVFFHWLLLVTFFGAIVIFLLPELVAACPGAEKEREALSEQSRGFAAAGCQLFAISQFAGNDAEPFREKLSGNHYASAVLSPASGTVNAMLQEKVARWMDVIPIINLFKINK